MAGGILTWMTGGDIETSGQVKEVAVFEREFFWENKSGELRAP